MDTTNEEHVKCRTPGCPNKAGKGAGRREYCPACYQRINRKRKEMGLSWEEMEATGRVPKRKRTVQRQVFVDSLIEEAVALKQRAQRASEKMRRQRKAVGLR